MENDKFERLNENDVKIFAACVNIFRNLMLLLKTMNNLVKMKKLKSF